MRTKNVGEMRRNIGGYHAEPLRGDRTSALCDVCVVLQLYFEQRWDQFYRAISRGNNIVG